AGAARDRRAFGERELFRHLDDRLDGHLQVIGVPAVRRDAVDGDARAAELRPADPAMRAHAATRVVVVHDALAGRRFLLAHARAAGDDDAAGLVAADERVLQVAQAERRLRRARRRA